MSNKQFFLLMTLVLGGFFGWMWWDSRHSDQEVQAQAANSDLLLGAPGDQAMVPVRYIFQFPDPVYSHALGTEQIAALSDGAGAGEYRHICGLTTADYKMDALYRFNWNKKLFQDQYVMWVEDFRVEFVYNTLTVYVSSQYPEGGCEYENTLAHEMRHVKIHRAVYQEYQQVLRQAVKDQQDRIPTSDHPITAASVEEGKTAIGNSISSAIDPVFQQFKDELAAQQATIDTEASYNALKAKCDHW